MIRPLLFAIAALLCSGAVAAQPPVPETLDQLLEQVREARSQEAERNVIHAYVTEQEFWSRTRRAKLEVVLLALPEFEQNLGVTRRIRARHDEGHIFAVVKYPEEIEQLQAAGVAATWNLYSQAGSGFADEVIAYFGNTLDRNTTPDAAVADS